jgi:hypothetical protein
MSMPKPVCPNMATAAPLGSPGPQTAQKQYAGSLEVDAQPSAAGIRLPEGAARKVSASVRRAYIRDTCAAPGPEPGTWKDPDPRRRSSRGSEGSEQACLLPGNGGYATPAGCLVSTTSWRYDLRRPCRLVTGRSHRPRSTWPDQARLPLPAVTHRYKRARCLWLEQFQIPAESASPRSSGMKGARSCRWSSYAC